MDSFLTEKQKRVLKMRREGKTQEEISEILKTSRSNVSLIEKRARKNIRRSEKTIEEWKRIISSMSIKVEEETDVLDVPKMVYERANKENVKVDLATVEIVEKIQDAGVELLNNRVVKHPFEVHVTESGEVLIEK